MIGKRLLVPVIIFFVLTSASCTNPGVDSSSTKMAVAQTATTLSPAPTETPAATKTRFKMPSKTPTSTATITLTKTPFRIAYYADRFDESKSGWNENDSADCIREYKDGGYRMLAKSDALCVS